MGSTPLHHKTIIEDLGQPKQIALFTFCISIFPQSLLNIVILNELAGQPNFEVYIIQNLQIYFRRNKVLLNDFIC